MTMQPNPWRRLLRPLIALVLGGLPFWVVGGIFQRTVINGQVVQDSSFNILGIVLAVIGVALVVKMLRSDGAFGQPPRWWPRTGLGILAGLLCLFQLGQSLGFYAVDPVTEVRDLRVQLLGRPEPSSSAGLDRDARTILESRSATADEARLRDDIVTTETRRRTSVVLYNLYSAACAGAYWQIPLGDLPGFLTDDDKAYIETAETEAAQRFDRRCGDKEANERMTGWLVDEIRRLRETAEVQVAAYAKRFPSVARPAATVRSQSLSAEGLPFWLGASVGEVQAALGTTAAPVPSPGRDETTLESPERGVTVTFTTGGQVAAIRLAKPFSGNINGVMVGDSPRSIDRRLAGAQISAFDPRGRTLSAESRMVYSYPLTNGDQISFGMPSGTMLIDFIYIYRN